MFSAYDLQLAQYFHTGRNSKTEEECKKDILEFLTENELDWIIDDEWPNINEVRIDKWYEDLWKNTNLQNELLDVFEVSIEEHKEPIEEDNW